MSGRIYTLFLMILGGFFVFILCLWGIFSLRENLSTNTMQSAVRTSLYDARDNSARVGRGTFIINKSKFKNKLAEKRLREFNGKKLSVDDFDIKYLADDNTNLNPSGNYQAIRAVRVTANLDTGKIKNKKANDDKHVVTYVIQTYGKNSSNDKKNDLTR